MVAVATADSKRFSPINLRSRPRFCVIASNNRVDRPRATSSRNSQLFLSRRAPTKNNTMDGLIDRYDESRREKGKSRLARSLVCLVTKIAIDRSSYRRTLVSIRIRVYFKKKRVFFEGNLQNPLSSDLEKKIKSTINTRVIFIKKDAFENSFQIERGRYICMLFALELGYQ